MSEVTIDKIVQKISDSPMIRLVVAAFLLGAAWSRFEYKSDRDKTEVMSVFKTYVIENEKDKVMSDYKFEELKKNVANNTAQLVTMSEFLRPEELNSIRQFRHSNR